MLSLKNKKENVEKGEKRLVKGHRTADSRSCNSIWRTGSTDTGRRSNGVKDRVEQVVMGLYPYVISSFM